MSKGLLSRKAESFNESVIREMTRLAQLHQAANPAQGMPDLPAPLEIKEVACRAIMDDINQVYRLQKIPRNDLAKIG